MGAVGTIGTIGTGAMENGKNFNKNFDESKEILIGTIGLQEQWNYGKYRNYGNYGNSKNLYRNLDESKQMTIGTI